MKHIFLLLAAFALTKIGIAQNSNYSIRDSINYVFEELNQTHITTGILYEKASPILNWENFGSVNDSTTSISIFKGIYKTLRNGAFNPNAFLIDSSLVRAGFMPQLKLFIPA
jgi:hypothetical protein